MSFKFARSQSSQVQVKSEKSVTTQTYEELIVTRYKFVPAPGQANEEAAQDYCLARDRERRTIKPRERYGHADLIAYALIAGKKIEDQEEPQSYDDALLVSRFQTPFFLWLLDESSAYIIIVDFE